MNSMHLSDDQVRVQGAPSYSVRAEIIDEHGQRHRGFLAVTPHELARLDLNRPESWPIGTRAVADGSMYSLTVPGMARIWRRIGEDRTRRPSPSQSHAPSAAGGQRWVEGRWQRGGDGKLHWVAGHYEQGRPQPAPAPSPRTPPAARPASPRPAPRPASPPAARPAAPPPPRPAPPRPDAPPPPRSSRVPWSPPQRRGPPSPHRDFDASYSAELDPSWGAYVHAVYDDGSFALHDGRTFGAQDVDHYYANGLIILRDGQQFVPPTGAHPVHAGEVTTWAAPVGVPGPESAVHNGVVFPGLPSGTIFFDEDHSFGYQTAQGEVVTGYWSPEGTYRVDDPAIADVRQAAAEGAAEGIANALEAMGGGTVDEGDDLLSLLE